MAWRIKGLSAMDVTNIVPINAEIEKAAIEMRRHDKELEEKQYRQFLSGFEATN